MTMVPEDGYEPFVGPYGVPCVMKHMDVTVAVNTALATALREYRAGNPKALSDYARVCREELERKLIASLGYERLEPSEPPLHPEWDPSHREIL